MKINESIKRVHLAKQEIWAPKHFKMGTEKTLMSGWFSCSWQRKHSVAPWRSFLARASLSRLLSWSGEAEPFCPCVMLCCKQTAGPFVKHECTEPCYFFFKQSPFFLTLCVCVYVEYDVVFLYKQESSHSYLSCLFVQLFCHLKEIVACFWECAVSISKMTMTMASGMWRQGWPFVTSPAVKYVTWLVVGVVPWKWLEGTRVSGILAATTPLPPGTSVLS